MMIEKDVLTEIEPEDFAKAYSTILVRERMRGKRFEAAFRNVKGKVLGQSKHPITNLRRTRRQVTLSKKDGCWTKELQHVKTNPNAADP